MKNKKLWLVVTILFAGSLMFCGSGKKKTSSGPIKKENFGQATGYAQIFDGDNSLARDRAIDDAMNKLVKQILGTQVEGKQLVQDFQLVESMISASSSGMVKNTKILKEGPEQGAFVVTLEGEVFPQAVDDTIAATLKNYGRPKFMVLIRETFEGKQNMPGFTVTELTMMEIMGKSGFEFVDAAMTQQLLAKERGKMQAAMGGSVSRDTANVLFDVGAEVIIIGTATTADQSGVMSGYGVKNMKSKQAIINIKALDVYTGRIIATTSQNAPGAHIDAETASKAAIQMCLKRILGKEDDDGKFKSGPFMNQITREFLKAATSRTIAMTIMGLNFNDLTKFKAQLQGRVRGVKKIYPRGQSGTTSKLDIEFAGKTHDLAEELKGKASTLGFEIEIKETYPNRMMLAVKRVK